LRGTAYIHAVFGDAVYIQAVFGDAAYIHAMFGDAEGVERLLSIMQDLTESSRATSAWLPAAWRVPACT